MNLGGPGGAQRRQAECIRWRPVRRVSKLALDFALPASRFVGMTPIPRPLLLRQGRLVFARVLAHIGLFVLVSWFLLQRVKSLRGAASILCALNPTAQVASR
jgi:hypothetical protein